MCARCENGLADTIFTPDLVSVHFIRVIITKNFDFEDFKKFGKIAHIECSQNSEKFTVKGFKDSVIK